MRNSISSTVEEDQITQKKSSNQSKFQDPVSLFLIEKTETLKLGIPLTSKDIFYIQNIKSNDIHGNLGWDFFYELIKNKEEQQAGYWTASHLATQMMLPKILLLKQKYDTGRVKIDEYDFIIDMQTAIRDYIPGYSQEKSQFACYLRPILEHVAYTYGRDASPYYIERNNFVVDSYDRRLEEGSYVPKDNKILDPEETLIEKEHSDVFHHLLSLSGIQYDGSMFEQISIEQMQNFVILQKFLGGLTSLKEQDMNFNTNLEDALSGKKKVKKEKDVINQNKGEDYDE